MRRLIMLLSLGVCLVMYCGLVRADDTKPAKKKHNPAEVFTKLDTDSDSKLSLDEFKAWKRFKTPEEAEKVFKKWDSDSDGKLTMDEFKAGMKEHHKPKKAAN